MGNRLTKSGITLKQLIDISKQTYKKPNYDDKNKRSKIDIIGGRIVFRRGLEYNRSTKQWEQTSREMRIDFIIKTDPESYKKTDTVPIHKYPITILFYDFSLGYNSPIRIRNGSNFKPRFPHRKVNNVGKISEAKSEKEKEEIRKKKKAISDSNQKIINWNILKGIQMQFYFDLEFVYREKNILFGPCYAQKSPKETNPQKIPFLDKHVWWIVIHILPRLFENPSLKNMYKNVVNKDRL